MNIELFKQTTKEDYERNLQKVIWKIKEFENNELFIRFINYDRSLLFGCCGELINTSQSGNLQNRTELDFLESITHFISYYILDDGEVTIKWHKYSLKKGKMSPAKETDKNAKPYLTYARDTDKVVREKEILWLLDWHEKNQKEWIEFLIKDDMYDNSMDEKEFIDYN